MNPIINNKKTLRNYEIIKTFVAGMVLSGDEVRFIREGRVSLVGSYIVVKVQKNSGLEVVCQHLNILGIKNYSIKLLLTRSQIFKLYNISNEANSTVIPVNIYRDKRFFKMTIAHVQSLKKHDIREKEKINQLRRNKWI